MNVRRLCRRLVLLVATLHGVCRAGAAVPSRLTNAGFEQVKEGKPTSWIGDVVVVSEPGAAHGGTRCVRLAAGDGSATMRSAMRRMYYTADARHRFAIWAKGKGEVRLGYDTVSPQPAGSPYTPYMRQRDFTRLSDDWRQVTFDFDVLDPRSARCINVLVELRGDGAEALLDDAVLELAPPAETEMCLTPVHGMVAPAGSIELTAALKRDGLPWGGEELLVTIGAPDGSVTTERIRELGGGPAHYRFGAPPDVALDAEKGVYFRFLVAHPPSHQARAVSVEVVSAEAYVAFQAAATEVRPPAGPAHVLFIGDSLSDFHRGFNYADKMAFWLQRAAGGRVTYTNVGVGGDFITRVWQRLNRDPKVYRYHAYERVLEPVPTHVVIFLGHNDSKVNSKSGTPCVPRERFAEEFRATIRKIQQETKARVIVMSSSSSDYAAISKRWPEWEAKRPKGFSKFGIPEVMEEFNAMMKAAANDLGAEYVDVYSPTRDHLDKSSLFMPDGVHVNNKGNRLLALELLKHLARE